MTQSFATAASAGAGSWLKKLALRAAGEEGAAENVLNEHGQTFGMDAFKAFDVEKSREEIRYQWETAKTNCVDTPAQAFAIYLNVFYLLPLTFLFGQFFVRSYMKKASKRRPSFHDIQDNIRTSSFAAARDVNREVIQAMSVQQGSHSDFEFAVGARDEDQDLKASSTNDREGLTKPGQLREEVQLLGGKAKGAATDAAAKLETLTKDLAEAAKETVSTTTEKLKKKKNKKASKGSDKESDKEGVKNEESEQPTKSYADVAKKPESEDKTPAKEEEDDDESKAKALAEGGSAAENSTSQDTEGDASETISIESTNEAAYEVNIDEATTKEEKEEEDKMQPAASSLFK